MALCIQEGFKQALGSVFFWSSCMFRQREKPTDRPPSPCFWATNELMLSGCFCQPKSYEIRLLWAFMFSFMRSVWKANRWCSAYWKPTVIQACKQEGWMRERINDAWYRGITEKYLVYWDWINIWTSSIKRADSQCLPPLCRLLTLHKSGPEDTSGNQLVQHQTSVPMAKALQMDHTLHINLVWTYSFSLPQA